MGALCVLKRRLAELTCCRQRQTNGDRSRFATTKSFMAGCLASARKVGLNLSVCDCARESGDRPKVGGMQSYSAYSVDQ